MSTSRLEAFSDGVIAIIITIMVLELKVPHDGNHLSDLAPVLPVLVSYVLSFVNVGIYWNNHHHLLHATDRVRGGIMWANLHLLFWLSLVPFVTAWMGGNHFAPVPTATYGFVMLLCGVAYSILQRTILHADGCDGTLARALGADLKGKTAVLLYTAAIPLAFVSTVISGTLFVLVAAMWLVPDRRIERAITEDQQPA